MTILLLGSSKQMARELRAPLPFRNGFHRFEHYPLLCEDWDTCWDYDVWGGAYHRQADKAFTNDHGTKKQSLAGLYFNKECFTGIEAFPPGTPSDGVFFLDFAQLKPRFDYSENGAMFGFNVNRTFCCGKWDVGMRANIPFRSVKVELDCCDFEEGLDDVCITKDEVIFNNNGDDPNVPANTSVIQNSYAYRLDFVASLPLTVNNIPEPPEAFMNFRNGMGAVAMNQKRVDNDNSTPIHVLSVQDDTRPLPPCSKRLFLGVNNTIFPPTDPKGQDQGVQNLPLLAADGSGVPVGDRAVFDKDTNYADGANALKNNVANQRKLWVVPTASVAGQTFELVNDATNIRDTIAGIIQNSDTSTEFLKDRGIVFDSQTLTGAGDLDVDFYFRRNWCDECRGDYYVEGIVGVRFPTGKKVKDPGKVLAQPLGNNRHFEVKLGAQTGWQPRDWFAVKADLSYSHVFKRTEKVAGAFTGATVKNIGPTVDAKVAWDYLIGNLDLTFVHPCSDACIGFDIGYQPYVKFKDKVSFKENTATDLLGNTQTLDDGVLENHTKQVVHRIKTEFFHKNCTWEVFAGWLHSVAGKNIQRETDWYVGFGVFF